VVHYISPVTVYVITRCVIDAGRRWVKAHVMNIYPRLLQNKCQYRRNSRWKSNRKKQRRNHIIPGYVYVFPERFPRVCYAYTNINGQIKVSSDSLPPRSLMLNRAHFSLKARIFISEPRKCRCLCPIARPRILSVSIQYEKFGRNDKPANKVWLAWGQVDEAMLRESFHRGSLSNWHSSRNTFGSGFTRTVQSETKS